MSATQTTGTGSALDPRERRRQHIIAVSIVAVVLLAIVAVFAVPAAWQRITAEPPLSTPTFGATDGLPKVLESGTEYTAAITVSIGADWERTIDPQGNPNVLVHATITSADNPEGTLICGAGVLPGTGVTLECPMEPLQGFKGLESTVTVIVGDAYGIEGSDAPRYTQTYQHVFG
jgi:hypothetical protein